MLQNLNMKITKKIISNTFFVLAMCLAITSCQKLERPALGNYPKDPPPPPYSTLKSFWAFEDNLGDSGQNRSEAEAVNVTYEAGINGKAAKIGDAGYVLVKDVSDSIKNPGSFTLSFWMNVIGPVQGGAQGVFALSNSKEFWGNLEIFLENLDNGNEAFLKIHMFNSGVASGNGEEWNEVKIPNALNKWTHLALTYEATTSKLSLYADGQPTALFDKTLGGGNYGPVKFADVTGMVLGNFAFETDPTLASHGAEDWARGINGSLDQFRIYKVALSAAEITNLFTGKL